VPDDVAAMDDGGRSSRLSGRACRLRALFDSFGPITQEWTIHDVIAEGDKVVLRTTNRCTEGEFLGVPAAGIEQVFTATFVLQIEDGLILRT
jgi:predicted ester cyclase